MKQSGSRLGAVALALVVTIAAFAIALPVSAQESNATDIDSCTTITEAGTYVLTADIKDSDDETCIRVEDGLDGVTIDGAGHTIDGVDGEGTNGIYAGRTPLDDGEATTDVTVENVVLTDWESGVAYENVEGGAIRDVEIESSEFAIASYFDTTDIEVTDSVLTGNDLGILALGGQVTIVDTVASNEVDYTGGATEDEGEPDHAIENFTLDSATVSAENRLEQVDFFGGGALLDLSAVESAPEAPDGFANVGGYVEANTNANAAGTFALSVHYDDADVPENVEESSLALYQYEDGEWTEVPGSAVDTDANTVSATFDDPAAFADGTVLAPLGQTDGDDTDDGDGNSGDDDKAGGDKSDDKKSDGDLVDVGAKDIAIDLGDVTIAGFNLRGPSLSDEQIDHRTYSVGDFDIAIEGVSFTIDETDYRFGHVTIEVEPFDVVLEDVTLGDGDSR